MRAGNVVWIFGTAKTGTSWLSAMLAAAPNCEQWREPYVGNLFGTHYYRHEASRRTGGDREWDDWILGGHRHVWIGALRSLVLEGASARFPHLTDGDHLVIKEPHGSIGAPLLMEALPESRMVFLVRDPRDVAASALAARMKGSWLYNKRHDARGGEQTLGDVSPDRIVEQRARAYVRDVGRAREAYQAHRGRKFMVRYEELRSDCLATMTTLHRALELPREPDELAGTVEQHAFENVPDRRKGPGKFRRSATPGCWRSDLEPAQARTVERITAPLLEEFYGFAAGPQARDALAVEHADRR